VDLRTQATSKKKWDDGLAEEIHFWSEWFRTQGMRWPEQYRERLDPNSPLQEYLATLIDGLPGEEISILDVGAGPLTTVGKTWKDRRLKIVAVDPLADVYDEILARHAVVPPVRTTWCHGELLNQRFPHDSFDLVWAVNALDHSYDPVEVILQAVDVVKIDRHVRLSHEPNEAENERYSGLHQWNFCSEKGRFIIWNRERRIDMSERLAPFAKVKLLSAEPRPEVAILKLRQRPRTVDENSVWRGGMIATGIGEMRRVFDRIKRRLASS
jgi:SAM-dependent methyltransferase